MSSELLGEGQPSERLAHACVQLPDGVKAVGVAGERADAIHGLSASCLGGLVFQERTCYVGGALTHEWSALCLEQASSLVKCGGFGKQKPSLRRSRERTGDMQGGALSRGYRGL